MTADPTRVPLGASTLVRKWFVDVDASIAPPPAAPVPTTATAGGTILAGTYQVSVTYVNVLGETLASVAGPVITTGTTSTITIPSPAAASGITGWYAYVSQVGGTAASATRQQAAGSPTAIGTALTLTAPPTSTGAALPGSPAWTPIYGIVNFQPTQNTTLQDDSDYDAGGFKSQTATAIEWGATLTVSRKVVAAAPTAYDPGQEKLRAAASLLGVANAVHVRFYEMTVGGPRIESYAGFAAVSWAPSGGAMDAIDQVQVTLTGQGQRQTPTHPYPGT